ncbi:DUF3558 domain-containing protein [Nocardia speluncae]|uniref:DUF3558 domain-containing protein n=1 Tax=Nocardia speluncae TaxID=419477 RepID=A0A846XKL9_9NOCA|nr:DUF3558 domain-containing protein [Nocardia speluncae]NKY35875.1 DUF3558 domain-containing protein [Nocardia speluncae]
MGIWRRSAYAVVAGASVVLVATGCQTSAEGSAEPSDTSVAGQSVAPEIPDKFDPCVDIPQSVLDTEGLHAAGSEPDKDEMRRGDIAWNGCIWVVSDGYSATISATNLTIDMVRDKAVPGTRAAVVHERPVIFTQPNGATSSDCTVNVELVGGSLEFLVDNPPSGRLTGDQDPCDIATRLAEKVLPLVPADA